jgi:hypothetical protein
MDLEFLRPALDAPGPMVTVCADVTHTSEKADTELDLRVRAINGRLTELGAPEAAVKAVTERLVEGNDDPDAGTLRGRAVVADGTGEVRFDSPLVAAPLREVVADGPTCATSTPPRTSGGGTRTRSPRN